MATGRILGENEISGLPDEPRWPDPGVKKTDRVSSEMKGARRIFGGRLAKPAVLGLALLSVAFLLHVTPHGHANNQDDPACLLCQVAHLGVTPAVTPLTFSIPLVPLGEVFALALVAESEAFISHSPSRAPPALLP